MVVIITIIIRIKYISLVLLFIEHPSISKAYLNDGIRSFHTLMFIFHIAFCFEETIAYDMGTLNSIVYIFRIGISLLVVENVLRY